MGTTPQDRSARNKTLTCTQEESAYYASSLVTLAEEAHIDGILNRVINQDAFSVLRLLPSHFTDVLILDPPYNISKKYNGNDFKKKSAHEYARWFDALIAGIKHTLKKTASIYVCSDWKTSILIAPILEKHFLLQNRVTWERVKGRGAMRNWKNNMEDIWFCTMSKDYCFNVDAVKLKKKVIAPYRENGRPKDWVEDVRGGFRLTHPSNIWTDISIPFWSMSENTNHPTQKPEKLLAKILLASSKKHDVIFDPFLGSGTTAVVSRKLNRHFVGIEVDTEYCIWALKRLHASIQHRHIQGYADGVFWERNSLSEQHKAASLPPVHFGKEIPYQSSIKRPL